MKHIIKQETKNTGNSFFWAPGNDRCHHGSGMDREMQGKESRAISGPVACWSWTVKGFIKVDRQAVFTGNNNVSEPCCGSVPARRPGGPSCMLASGDPEGRLAYSESVHVRLSILITTDGLDVVLGAMNKGVGVFAGCRQASSCHHDFTVSATPATWFRIIVLGQEVFVPGVVLSQGRWGQTQTQHEDQHQGTQAHHHVFQQRLLLRAKGGVVAQIRLKGEGLFSLTGHQVSSVT